MASHTADLRIEVDALQRGPREFDFDVSPRDLELEDDPEFTFAERVTGHVRASFAGQDNVYVSCTLETRASASCVRCLEPLPVQIQLKLALVYLPLPPQGADDADPEDEEKLYYTGGMIHLGERLREEIMLALPFLPACTLEADNMCPVRGERIDLSQFGESTAVESSSDSESSTANASWLSQLKQVRRQLDGESDN